MTAAKKTVKTVTVGIDHDKVVKDVMSKVTVKKTVVKKPNATTKRAMKEGADIIKSKSARFNSVEEVKKALTPSPKARHQRA